MKLFITVIFLYFNCVGYSQYGLEKEISFSFKVSDSAARSILLHIPEVKMELKYVYLNVNIKNILVPVQYATLNDPFHYFDLQQMDPAKGGFSLDLFKVDAINGNVFGRCYKAESMDTWLTLEDWQKLHNMKQEQ